MSALMTESQKDTPVVVNPDRMSDENFIKHFNKRHADQLAGLRELVNLSPAVLILYRSFHRWLHYPLFPASHDLDHKHEG
jgi:hypothetical protein